MTKVIWSNTAVSDLKNIYDYIALDSEIYAQALIDDIFNAIEQIANFPKSGRVVPEIKKKKFREIFLGNYRIIYSVTSKQVRIVTIIHGARRL